ncbi:MAG: type IV pilus biogenesis/stability protein PilW [Burkholderiaceae bacterium]
MTRLSWRAVCAGLMTALALLGGCAGGLKGAAEPTRDRVTASDETQAAALARLRLELAAGYFGRGQMTTALDQVKLALIADPRMSAGYNLRGLIYANLGDEQLAEESFQRALQLDARDADVMQNYGWYLCQRKRYGEADALFMRALDTPQYRDSPRTLLTQGMCMVSAGRLDAAEQALSRSAELDPGNPRTAVELSELLYRRGEYLRARGLIRRVNDTPDLVAPRTLWLALRIENRLGNTTATQDLGRTLRSRFPEARETGALARGAYDE